MEVDARVINSWCHSLSALVHPLVDNDEDDDDEDESGMRRVQSPLDLGRLKDFDLSLAASFSFSTPLAAAVAAAAAAFNADIDGVESACKDSSSNSRDRPPPNVISSTASYKESCFGGHSNSPQRTNVTPEKSNRVGSALSTAALALACADDSGTCLYKELPASSLSIDESNGQLPMSVDAVNELIAPPPPPSSSPSLSPATRKVNSCTMAPPSTSLTVASTHSSETI